ncbi:MAG: ribonuclease HII [Epulopiscium sp. Nele67-Bin001]|nr:MAG: ribonuclease HII [Epulopiscium sp. Nuni2H_MBin001]OON90858.1 MAG: ribonuclease HII [Epulopiscium sp. Nele67-Bin001]
MKSTPIDKLEACLDEFKFDDRDGVQKLINKYKKHLNELNSWQAKLDFDAVWQGQEYLVGVDEVGRGPLAGNVVAAAVILPKDVCILGLKDSKKLSESKRELLYDEIMDKALAIGIGEVSACQIDKINILQATFEAMRLALNQIDVEYDVICVDGNHTIPLVNTKQYAIVGGDNKSAAIAAASVIAKVTRDRQMNELHLHYPEYDFISNKGYGTKKHYDGIAKLGITNIHRKSFLRGII